MSLLFFTNMFSPAAFAKALSQGIIPAFASD